MYVRPAVGKRNIGIIAVLALCLCPISFAAPKRVLPAESTLAYELFVVEREVGQPHAEAERLLLSLIEEATTAAFRQNREPRTREQALGVLEQVQLVLVRRNFLQPEHEKDWPATLGVALTPLVLADDAREAALRYNARRVPYLDQSKPLYYVDCDMGALIFLAVGERLGWDLRLVEVPKHNFVRWHLPSGLEVNWDWTHWGSFSNVIYASRLPASGDPRISSLYLRSFTPAEAKGYYLGLIGSRAEDPKDRERLLLEAIELAPSQPITLNNLAWLYATSPELAATKASEAVALALGSWSLRPDDLNIADTVACAFAAAKATDLARQVQKYAIERAQRQQDLERVSALEVNLGRISEGKLCE